MCYYKKELKVVSPASIDIFSIQGMECDGERLYIYGRGRNENKWSHITAIVKDGNVSNWKMTEDTIGAGWVPTWTRGRVVSRRNKGFPKPFAASRSGAIYYEWSLDNRSQVSDIRVISRYGKVIANVHIPGQGSIDLGLYRRAKLGLDDCLYVLEELPDRLVLWKYDKL